MMRSLAVVFVLASASLLPATEMLPGFTFTPTSGISLRAANFFEKLPPGGLLPVRFEIRNDSGQARTWTVRAVQSQSGYATIDFSTEIRAEPGEQTIDLLIPLATQSRSTSRYSNMRFVLSGYGVKDGTANIYSPGYGNVSPYLGMGEQLSVKHWGELGDQLKKNGSRSLDGTPLNTEWLPSDWRGFAGFEIIVLTAQEWRRIAPGPRGALTDWVHQGGHLVLVLDGGANGDLPPAGPAGVGRIAHWADASDLVGRVIKALDDEPASVAEKTQRSYTWDWTMAEPLGHPETPKFMILAFVLIFAVVVGPINFFVFAPLGARHRLFWTTPLISVAASVLMAVFIFFSEGLGGKGSRFQALLCLPNENKLFLWQEQVSRTGVLLGNSFVLSDPDSLLLPIRIGEAEREYRGRREESFSLAGDRWSGDWFRSRSSQGQMIASVVPTRGRLAFGASENGVPSVLSTFETEVTDVWYQAAEGIFWRAERVAPGEKVVMKSAGPAAFKGWLTDALKPAGPVLSGHVMGFAKSHPSGTFFASVPNPPFVATLPGIRWKDAGGVVFGRAQP